MSYDNVTKDANGWPVGTTDAAKLALTWAVKLYLERVTAGAELWVLVDHVKYTVPKSVWDRPVLVDYQYAAVERAARNAGAIPVWQLKPESNRT